ncbi:MAG: hypothetical protein RIF41_33175 [Polyangiaceae bacterium]
MRIKALVTTSLMMMSLALTGATVAGCGPGKGSAKTANVEAGTMPADADWSGVYYSPLFGHLHMVQSGNLVEGKWQRPRKGEWGKLQGNVDGNLLRFDWEEYVDGLVGPNSKKTGKGYFVYSRPAGDNVDDAIKGEIGRGEDEVGTEWEAIKQRNVDPQLDAIGGVGSTDVGGGDWDSGNGEEGGDLEGPVEPDDGDAPEL